jgi:hypothetical protein
MTPTYCSGDNMTVDLMAVKVLFCLDWRSFTLYVFGTNIEMLCAKHGEGRT